MSSDEDYTELDAAQLLAIGLMRLWYAEQGYEGVRKMVYSNGTEHDWHVETAEAVFRLAPMLKLALMDAVRRNPQIQRYAMALHLGDRDVIAEFDGEEEAA